MDPCTGTSAENALRQSTIGVLLKTHTKIVMLVLSVEPCSIAAQGYGDTSQKAVVMNLTLKPRPSLVTWKANGEST